MAMTPPLAWGELSSRYEALIRLLEAIRSRPNPEDLFEILVKELREFVPFAGIVQFDGTVNRTHWHFLPPYAGLAAEGARSIVREQSIPWWVHQHQQPVFLQTGRADPRFPHLDIIYKFGIRSVFAMPLSTARRRLGSLLVGSEREDAYSEQQRRLLIVVANQIALAIDDALNLTRLRLLFQLTNRVIAKLELPDLLQEISVSIRQVMQCDGVGVVLPDAETGELRLTAIDSSGHRAGGPPVASKFAQAVFQSGQMANLTKEQIAAEPAFAGTLQSFCSFPLTSHGRVLGLLGLGSARENAFTEDDLCFLGQVANQIALAVENALAFGELSQLKDRLARQNVYLESEIRSELHFEEIVGKSKALKRVLAQIETVAPADSTVLIYGETGTGKELIARAVHNLSSRKANAFVKLNCAAIPTGLLESELFGHEKGAFTGAIAQRIGRFELAHRGTIFLDEIGEIPLELQPKLLRVLQEREFERLGSVRTLRTDARLIAATNRDLKSMVDGQEFRSDLYYRLNVFPIRVPPLRERTEDIPLLVRHFVQEFSRRNNRTIDAVPSEAMEAMVRYPWPGNIRELQNVIERAVIVSKGPLLSVPIAELLSDAPAKPVSRNQDNLHNVLQETERAQILQALEQAHWVVAGPNGAAARLGMKRSTLQLRMQKLGIRVARVASQQTNS
jgi:formate hydrogenlyase transcriptional activator